MVMAFVILKVPEAVLNVPTHGTIQYHPSLLPRHRGPSAINWAIIHGDEKAGLAIFWPDDGLDTGPVLMTKEVEITPDDTLGSLYFDKLFPLGIEAMLESVDLVREGRAPRIAQVEEDATYESWCRPGGRRDRLVAPGARRAQPDPRGRPAPGRVDDRSTARRSGSSAPSGSTTTRASTPGEVVAVDGDRLVVAADGGAIAVGVVRADGEKTAAGDYAREAGPARRRAARRRRPEGRLTPFGDGAFRGRRPG